MSVENALWDDFYRDGSGYVYLLVCQDDGGRPFVKIGCTIDPVARIPAILTSCPLEAKEFAICEVFRGRIIDCNIGAVARSVEQSLHRSFAHKRIRGEWFGIDIKSDGDKAEFAAAWREAISANRLTPRPWKHMSMASFRKRRAKAKEPRLRAAFEAAVALSSGRIRI